MRRIQLLCLCVLASAALKPPCRQNAAVRPRARAPVAKGILGVPRGGGRPIPWGRGVAEGIILYTALTLAFEHNVVLRLLSLGQIMDLDMIEKKWLRAVGLATSLAVYVGSFCKPWPKSGFLTWSVLAYWAYALKQIYLAGGRAAVLSKEVLVPTAYAIAGYFLLANLPELLGIALRAGTGG